MSNPGVSGLALFLRRSLAVAAAVSWALSLRPECAGDPPAEPPIPARLPTRPAVDPFARFTLPQAWQERFWSSPNARALFALEPKRIAALMPVQAGVKFCGCPACDADEADDPLGWYVAAPRELTCGRCGARVATDALPARDDKKPVSEETVEVRPGLVHHYPYQEVPPERQRYPGERLYLAAKADHEAREFLAKAALYAAVRARSTPPDRRDPRLARVASVILLRSAQVYPSYAMHYDQPASPKTFEKADLAPPYRRGYTTAKWDWTGSLDVPLNLVVAYALLRDDPALVEAGRLLGDPDPRRTIEHDLFRASAGFVARQPAEISEPALLAVRGLLAVGRLLDDQALVQESLARLHRFTERGFHHDGYWRNGTLAAHRRVVGQLDGWFGLLLDGLAEPSIRPPSASRRPELPMLPLARAAGSAVLTEPNRSPLQLASWPAASPPEPPRGPTLLGGAGIARLAVGQGADALDLELRSLDAFGPDRIVRQALRLGAGGRILLDDLDESPELASGWGLASVSRNTVVVDGLNQRESLARAQEPAAGGNFLYYAADPDFQVVTLDDPRSYPQSTTRYRQTLVAASGARARYALSVFEVRGGLQHDQVHHAPATPERAGWQLSTPTSPAPESLLPAGFTFVPTARARDGRWFVQSFGAFRPEHQATIDRPASAAWVNPVSTSPRPGLRLHLLGDTPLQAIAALGPVPGGGGRPALIARRRSREGSSLDSTFVTVYEPTGTAFPPLTNVARIAATAGMVVVALETADGPVRLVVNLAPGTVNSAALGDGRSLTTDGLAVRVAPDGLTLAGGTFAEVTGAPPLQVRQAPATGTIVAVARQASEGSRGWFQTNAPLPDPDGLVGRTLLIGHGEILTRGWTVTRVDNTSDGARVHVREEPGFALDPATKAARYYQFPQWIAAGPHRFRISRIARSNPVRSRAGPD